MRKLTPSVFLAAVAWIPTVADAGSVYSYTGNGYTTFNARCFASVADVAGCTFDPLVSFSISDGQYDVSGAPDSAEFAVLNTANGAITSWEAGYVTAF